MGCYVGAGIVVDFTLMIQKLMDYTCVVSIYIALENNPSCVKLLILYKQFNTSH